MNIPTLMEAQSYRRPFGPKAGDAATNYSPSVTTARPDAHYPAKRRVSHRDQQRVDLAHIPTLAETHIYRNPIRPSKAAVSTNYAPPSPPHGAYYRYGSPRHMAHRRTEFRAILKGRRISAHLRPIGGALGYAFAVSAVFGRPHLPRQIVSEFKFRPDGILLSRKREFA